jgi:hypothetical protein
MKLFTNWKTALVTLVIFSVSMVFLPGFTSMAIAADSSTTSDTGPGPADTSAAEAAGSAGGAATFAGLSTGTIVIGTVVVAGIIAVAVSAGSGGGSSTSHH